MYRPWLKVIVDPFFTTRSNPCIHVHVGTGKADIQHDETLFANHNKDMYHKSSQKIIIQGAAWHLNDLGAQNFTLQYPLLHI